jgi:hypothetical protein
MTSCARARHECVYLYYSASRADPLAGWLADALFTVVAMGIAACEVYVRVRRTLNVATVFVGLETNCRDRLIDRMRTFVAIFSWLDYTHGATLP